MASSLGGRDKDQADSLGHSTAPPHLHLHPSPTSPCPPVLPRSTQPCPPQIPTHPLHPPYPTLPYLTLPLRSISRPPPSLQAQLHPCVHPTLSPSYFCAAGLGHLHRSHRELLRPPFRRLALLLVVHPGLGGLAHDLLCRFLALGGWGGRAVFGMSKPTPQGEKIGGSPVGSQHPDREGRLQILWTPRELGGGKGWEVGGGGRPLGPFLAQEFSTCVPTG